MMLKGHVLSLVLVLGIVFEDFHVLWGICDRVGMQIQTYMLMWGQECEYI